MEDHVSTRSNGYRDYCGVGNVINPMEYGIDEYQTSCKNTGTVSVILENGGRVDNVQINISALKQITFPPDYTSLGSQVVWLNLPKKNQPIVIAILSKNNELIDISQYSDEFGKSSSNSTTKVMVDSSKGVVIVLSNSQTQTGGDIYIISTNKSKSSKLNLQISGGIVVQSGGDGFSYQDINKNIFTIDKNGVQIKPSTILKIGDGTSPIPLGNLLTAQLELELTRMNAVITALGTLGVTITLPPGNYSQVLSKISNTD